MKIKSLILNSILIFSFHSSVYLHSQERAEEEEKSFSKDERIKIELQSVRSSVLSDRPYTISNQSHNLKSKIIINPYKLATTDKPDWWSERQAYDMSYLLLKALNYYPGIEASLSKTWEQKILEEENIFTIAENKDDESIIDEKESITFLNKLQDKLLINLNKKDEFYPDNQVNLQPNKSKIQNTYINPIINGYKFQVLTPKVRGVGLGFVAINSKTCSNETFLDSSYQISTPLNTQISSELSLDEILIKQLIEKETKGSSVNFNLILGATGGGKYKPPEKSVKDVIYASVVDASEGIYCSLSGDKQCVKYYSERDFKYPTVEKKSKKKKKKKKGC